MGEFSLSHILIVGAVLLLFGPSRLPGLGKSLGEAIRGFKKGISPEDEKPAQTARPEQISANATPAPEMKAEVKSKDHV